MDIDTKTLLQTIDLTDLIASDLGQPIKTSGKYVFFRCPFHNENTPSFAVTPDRYYCFGCHASGDGIKWLMDYRGMSFLDACKALSPYGLKVDAEKRKQKLTQANTDAKKQRPDELQASWREIIDVCQKQLWSDKGKGARDYLHNRGLNDNTLQSPFYRVGYSEGQKIAGIWVDKGVVLPCFTVDENSKIDYVDYVKIRRGKSWVYRPDDLSKYRKLFGNGSDLSGLYGCTTIRGASSVFVTEGEFDCMLLNQEAGDIVGVCTLGSASDSFDWLRFGKYLVFTRWFLIAYDNDDAGDKAFEAWQSITGRAKRVKVSEGKDITEAWQSGVNLSDWVLSVLVENNL